MNGDAFRVYFGLDIMIFSASQPQRPLRLSVMPQQSGLCTFWKPVGEELHSQPAPRAGSKPTSQSIGSVSPVMCYFSQLSDGGRPARSAMAGSVGNLKTPRSVTSLIGGGLRMKQNLVLCTTDDPLHLSCSADRSVSQDLQS